MKPIYLREQDRYTYSWDELVGILKRCSVSEEDAEYILRRLKGKRILNGYRAPGVSYDDALDFRDEDDAVCYDEANSRECRYNLKFVGVVAVKGYVLACYPKYLPRIDDGNETYIKEEMRRALKAVKKYRDEKRRDVRIFDDLEDSTGGNLIDLYLFFLQDYYENGLYGNAADIVETNGSGAILWDKTVNEIDPIFSGGRPIYPEVYTGRRVDDEYDYFRRLHKFALTKATEELEEAGLLYLFGLGGACLSEESESDLGDNGYKLYRLNRELDVQFNSRKQSVLKAMRILFSEDKKLSDVDYMAAYGTRSFNLVWEKALGAIFDNKRDEKLKYLGIPLRGEFESSKNREQTLMDLIDKPHWTKPNEHSDRTLEPDVVCMPDDGISKRLFLILDAKYYTPTIEEGKAVANQPGVEDIAKQYLYRLAFRRFIESHELLAYNCFIFPTAESEVIDAGEVRLNFLSDLELGDESAFEREDVKVRFLPAKEVFDKYLCIEKLTQNVASYLKLDISKEEAKKTA